MSGPSNSILRAAFLTASILSAGGVAYGQTVAAPAPAPVETPAKPAADAPAPSLEPDALAVLKGMSDRLRSASTMSFTALTTYESPALNGQPLYYTLRSAVMFQRPNKLAVITPGDGPPSELYYDGKTVVAFNPELNAAAVEDAPSTVDAMLKALNEKSATYYPFADIVAADPYADIMGGLKSAFVVGKSHAYGGTETIMLALASDSVQAELWVDTTTRLPLMVRAVFPNDPNRGRFEVEFSDWRLNAPLKPGVFMSDRARKAPRMPFARPDAEPPKTQ